MIRSECYLPATLNYGKLFLDNHPIVRFSFYRPQRSWGKVIFSQVSVILSTRGHVWLQGGMHGCGGCVLLLCGGVHGCGGHAWLQGACMVVGGVHGCGGACMVAGGMHGCRGACMVVGGVCCYYVGGMHDCGGGMHGCGGVHGCRGHARLQGGMYGCRGCAWLWGACMVAGGHAWLWGCAWLQGVCKVAGEHVWLQGACMVVGGVHGCGGCVHGGRVAGWGAYMGYDEIRSMSGQYTSYWNAFLWLDAFTFMEFRVNINKSTHAIDRKIFSEYFYDAKLCRVRLIFPSVIEDHHCWMVSEGRLEFIPCDIIIEKVLCTKLSSKSNYHLKLRGLHDTVKTSDYGFHVCIIELPEITWNMPWSLLKNHSERHSVKPNWMPRGQGIPVKFIDCLPLMLIEGLLLVCCHGIFCTCISFSQKERIMPIPTRLPKFKL